MGSVWHHEEAKQASESYLLESMQGANRVLKVPESGPS